MSDLILASVFLPLSHFGLSSSQLRATLADRLGEQGFLTLYKLVTLAAFAWLIVSYRRAPTIILWTAPAALKVAALPVVMLSFVLVVTGIATPNPTVVGAQRLFANPNIIRGILRVTRNAFLWGVGLWAAAHAICTGDAASVLMFGSIGTLGLAGAPMLDAKKAKHHGAEWSAFAGATSSVPFFAIVRGRQRLVLSEIGWWRIALSMMLFFAALYAHHWAVGAWPLPHTVKSPG
jgi:uncharacterized membrane protein